MQKNVILQTSNTQKKICYRTVLLYLVALPFMQKNVIFQTSNTQKETLFDTETRAPLHSSKPHAQNIRQNGKPEKSRQEHKVPIMHATNQQTMHDSRMTSDIWNQLPAQVQRFPATVSHSFLPQQIRSLAKPCHQIPCQINQKKATSMAQNPL
jgi:hypothetical protein